MTTKKFTNKSGDTFEWDETPELVEALKKLNKPVFAGNYQGPLYAPHPELKRPKQRPTTDSTEK
tara:strand:- start:8 stop:199 length:192 start_codon:yes stop_codon:yes gene_type:complete